MWLKIKKSHLFTAGAKSVFHGDNMVNHRLLHISGLIGPTSGNTIKKK